MMNIIAKKIGLVAVLVGISWSTVGAANTHQHSSTHPKHNMVVFGENEVFASHIVYKQPHNFQVVLKLNMKDSDRSKYLQERERYPNDQFILLLDEMDIAKIASIPAISGTLFRDSTTGDQRVEVISKIELSREEFRLMYFDELPLSLESMPTKH